MDQSSLTLQAVFDNLPEVTRYMLEFAQKHNLEHTISIKPETTGCFEASLYRPNLSDGHLSVDKNTEVRAMFHENGTGFLLLETRAAQSRDFSKIRNILKKHNPPVKIGSQVDDSRNIIGLVSGEFNLLAVKYMAEKFGRHVRFVVSSDLISEDKPFSHNAGSRNHSIVFASAKKFYETVQKEGIDLLVMNVNEIGKTNKLNK